MKVAFGIIITLVAWFMLQCFFAIVIDSVMETWTMEESIDDEEYDKFKRGNYEK